MAKLSRPAPRLELPRPAVPQPSPKFQLARGVYIVPSAAGTTRLMGITSAGTFVAEYACPTEDFTEQHIAAMARAVAKKERAKLSLVP